MHWVDITADPVAPEIHRFLIDETRRAKRHATVSYPAFLRDRVAGRSVLDVGIVEHDLTHVARPDWVHDIIRSSCRSSLGIDILEEGVSHLAGLGYEVALVDATSERDLGRRFDVVHIGDVIEHVDNPVAMLRFARRPLAEGGEVLVRTPNPWWYQYIVRNQREVVFVANAEHVSWVTPTLALELARRTDLALDEYWLMREPSRAPWVRLAHRLMAESELLSPNYLYVFSAPH